MYNEYTPNSLIVDKAVSIWKSWMHNPKYDNLGISHGATSILSEGVVPNLIASSLADRMARSCVGDDMEKFGECLKKILMESTEFREGYSNTTNYLSVDYDPCQALSLAGKLSGIKRNFPWKTSMYIGEKHLSYRYGYGAPNVYVYPLKNGNWLETTLNGDDMEKIISLVDTGVLNDKLEKI
jgi:hypothetical protein